MQANYEQKRTAESVVLNAFQKEQRYIPLYQLCIKVVAELLAKREGRECCPHKHCCKSKNV